jgi:hypothetical protein
MAIGEDFIAPVVPRKTRGVRLRVIATKEGSPAIREFSAYDAAGEVFNDADGTAATRRVGK